MSLKTWWVNFTKIPEVASKPPEAKKDISEPIYLLVEKIINDPKRLEFNEVGTGIAKQSYTIYDKVSGIKGAYTSPSYYYFEYICIEGLTLTKDEKSYIKDKLVSLYQSRVERKEFIRQLRLDRKERYNRLQMKQLLEGENK